MAKFRVEFFYDVVSPWSWLGFETAVRYATQYSSVFTLVMRPFFLGGVMKATGNQPPAVLPARGAYMAKDLARSFVHHHMPPFQFPTRFPLNTIKSQRLLTALSLEDDSQPSLQRASRALWVAYWGRDLDISDDDTIRSVLTSAGFTNEHVESLLRAATTDSIKDRLKDATDEAVARGAFGAPTFYVSKFDDPDYKQHAEMFFGSDRFHLLMPMLGITWQGPLPASSAAGAAKL